jgi:hypothetical protein
MSCTLLKKATVQLDLIGWVLTLVRSLCYWPTLQTGIQRIEECVHKKYDRRPIGPLDVIRIILISYNVVFFVAANEPPCHALEGALSAISMRVKNPIFFKTGILSVANDVN